MHLELILSSTLHDARVGSRSFNVSDASRSASLRSIWCCLISCYLARQRRLLRQFDAREIFPAGYASELAATDSPICNGNRYRSLVDASLDRRAVINHPPACSAFDARNRASRAIPFSPIKFSFFRSLSLSRARGSFPSRPSGNSSLIQTLLPRLARRNGRY